MANYSSIYIKNNSGDTTLLPVTDARLVGIDKSDGYSGNGEVRSVQDALEYLKRQVNNSQNASDVSVEQFTDLDRLKQLVGLEETAQVDNVQTALEALVDAVCNHTVTSVVSKSENNEWVSLTVSADTQNPSVTNLTVTDSNIKSAAKLGVNTTQNDIDDIDFSIITLETEL